MKSFDNISFICENLLVLNMKRETLALLYKNQDDGGRAVSPAPPQHSGGCRRMPWFRLCWVDVDQPAFGSGSPNMNLLVGIQPLFMF